MLPIISNLLPLLISFGAGVGVLIHDTQIDNAFTKSLALPIELRTEDVNSGLKLSDAHVHAEHISVTSTGGVHSQPTVQPRNDEKKYLASKKLSATTSGSDYSWPSV